MMQLRTEKRLKRPKETNKQNETEKNGNEPHHRIDDAEVFFSIFVHEIE